MRIRLLALASLSIILATACEIEIPVSGSSDNDDNDSGLAGDTVDDLDRNGVRMEPYDPDRWGDFVAADQVPGTSSQPPGPVGAATTEPVATDPIEEVSTDPGPQASRTVPTAPNPYYRFAVLRLCLEIRTDRTTGSGGVLSETNQYCRVPRNVSGECRSARSLIESVALRQEINRLSDENLNLGSVLTSTMGFEYVPDLRNWQRVSPDATVEVTPLRVLGITLEEPCNPFNSSSDTPNADNQNPVANDNFGGAPGEIFNDAANPFITNRLELSSRLAIPRRASLMQNELILIPASSNGTAEVFDAMIGRYLPDGTLDTSFGEGGYAYIKLPGGSTEAYAVVADNARQRIYVAGGFPYREGSAPADGNRGFVAALDYNGQIDQTWGTEGLFRTQRMAVQLAIADGRLIVSDRSSLHALTIESGILDAAFGLDGVLSLDNGEAFATHRDLIVVAGTDYSATGNEDLKLMVYKGPGDLVAERTLPMPDSREFATDVTITPDNIYVTGRSTLENIDPWEDGYFVAKFDLGSFEPVPEFEGGGIFRSSAGWEAGSIIATLDQRLFLGGGFGVHILDHQGPFLENYPGSEFFYADTILLLPSGRLVAISIAHGGGELWIER